MNVFFFRPLLNLAAAPSASHTRYKATPLPTASGFLRYSRACSLGPVRQGAPAGVPQGTWWVLWERMVGAHWVVMEVPISPYHWLGLLAHIPTSMHLLPRLALYDDKKTLYPMFKWTAYYGMPTIALAP
jgi:hypothetical protein